MAIERITPGTIEWDAYYANHITRYQFAAEKLKESRYVNLLDAACGVGYGADHLSGIDGVKITAIDRSELALSTALKQFKKPNINFIIDDCHTLENASASGPFDAIISFETLEHLPYPEQFLKSSFNNLGPAGMLVVSTPNQLVSSPGNALNWEYHEKEYTAAELYSLLITSGFTNIQLYGQQLNLKGKIKNELRADLNRLWSNPFVRFGKWIQGSLRGRSFNAVLKETIDDFEIIKFDDAADIDRLLLDGPFVLIAIAFK